MAGDELGLQGLRFDNSFARLPECFYTRLAPQGLPRPYPVAFSEDTARLLGLTALDWANPEFVEFFAGNRALSGSEPLAAVYSGHQFGVWAGRLGDGRAHLLGGVEYGGQTWELQLKGAGPTPYSRGADGRAVLRSSIREFLCSEAMAALGIPSTRALCIVGSEHPVRREQWETAAVVTRVAPSFVRFGSFEHWAARRDEGALRRLADYVLAHFYPELAAQDYVGLLRAVAEHSARLVAEWMAVGFMHGVLNTDNMSILGLTLDYGPFGFMDAFDPEHICNHSDHEGRYAWNKQPDIVHWNVYALANALLPLIKDVTAAREAVDGVFSHVYEQTYRQRMGAKLGLLSVTPDDEQFLVDSLRLLQWQRLDYTLFFRRLSALGGQADEVRDALLLDECVDPVATRHWLARWRQRLTQQHEDDATRQSRMRACNPKYVLRNWLAEEAIRAAEEGDFQVVAQVLQCLRQPYDEHPEYQRFAASPPDWAQFLCVSCSS